MLMEHHLVIFLFGLGVMVVRLVIILIMMVMRILVSPLRWGRSLIMGKDLFFLSKALIWLLLPHLEEDHKRF